MPVARDNYQRKSDLIDKMGEYGFTKYDVISSEDHADLGDDGGTYLRFFMDDESRPEGYNQVYVSVPMSKFDLPKAKWEAWINDFFRTLNERMV